MEFIKTVSLRFDKETNSKIKELQELYKQKFGIQINQSNLIRKIINDVHKEAFRKNPGLDIKVFQQIANK